MPEVYVHDATATDLNAPRDSYTLGRPDSLLAPIFRLYRYKNGHYAALLPDVATTLPQRQPLPASGCLHREAQAASRIEVVKETTNYFAALL